VRFRRVLAIVALTCAVTSAAGCAIPTESGPRSISPDRVPFDLLSPVIPVTTTTEPPLSSLVPVKVFFLSTTQQLAPAERVVVSPAPLAAVINALLAGPTSTEVASGTTTAIPENVSILSAVVQGNLVTLNFNDAFAQVTGTATEVAVSQVVATVAALNGLATGVIFEINGQRTSVPIASGAQVPGPVYLLQFIPNAQ
jgi:sporulation and spore germination protein